LRRKHARAEEEGEQDARQPCRDWHHDILVGVDPWRDCAMVVRFRNPAAAIAGTPSAAWAGGQILVGC
jgi:hypothetical protein